MHNYTKFKKKEWSASSHGDQRTKTRSKYPASPAAGPGILKKYDELLRKAIKGKKKFRGCVLGATPELRDLVLKYGGELVTVDISEEMIKKCNPLMKYKKHPRENILARDWLKTGLPAHYFDVILGDGASNNIALGDQNNFFQETARLLKPSGRLILREAVANPARPIRTVKEISDDFTAGKIHWFDAYLDLYFYSELTRHCQDRKAGKSEMAKFWPLVLRSYEEGRLNKNAFDAMWWLKGTLVHTFLERPHFEKIIGKYFQLLPVDQAKDFKMSRDTIIFFFGKKRCI